MCEIGLGDLTGTMDLRKDDLLLGTMLDTPGRDMALQGAKLDRLVALRMLGTQQRKERGCLKGGIALQLHDNPWPIVGEWIGAGAVGALVVTLAGKGGEMVILASGTYAHPSASCGEFLGQSFGAFSFQEEYLGVFLHGVLLDASLKQARYGPENRQV
jgi:hypothetical protein